MERYYGAWVWESGEVGSTGEVGKEGQIPATDDLLKAFQRLFDSKRTGSGHNALYRGWRARCHGTVHGSHLSALLRHERDTSQRDRRPTSTRLLLMPGRIWQRVNPSSVEPSPSHPG